MVMILLNWLYMATTCFLTGFALLSLFGNIFQYKIQYRISYFFAGLLGVTVYAEFYSLFAGVSRGANLLLLGICFGVLIFWKKEIIKFFINLKEQYFKTAKETTITIIVFTVLVLTFAYGTSRGYMHFDTALYHAHSIRWIEDFGVVPGLGNLQSRFAYNSAAFPLTALYSMKGVFGQSIHATAGFFALLSAFIALDIKDVFVEKKWKLSHFVRMGLIFYLGVIFGEIVSPASDYYAQLLIFDILILWLEQDEKKKERDEKHYISDGYGIESYSLLCILLVYAVTIKFSVALLLLLVIKPAIELIRSKKWKEINICILSGFFTALPFFIRNVIISGWILYPSTALDLFSVDWKIPKGQADLDRLEIGAYGKGYQTVEKWNADFEEWIPLWFQQLKSLEKIFVLATAVAIAFLFFSLIVVIIKKKKEQLDFYMVTVVFSIASVFWFLSAPLIRYGYAYIITVPLLVFGFCYIKIAEKSGKNEFKFICLFRGMIVLFLISRIPGLYEDVIDTLEQPYYFAQRDYDSFETETVDFNGNTFYIPLEKGQIGYDQFPSSMILDRIEMRGENLKNGFRQIVE